MLKPGQSTHQEILSQSQAWKQALDVTQTLGEEITRLWRDHPGLRVIFTGCGSTYYLSLAAASTFTELTGRGAKAIPAGELFLYPQNHYEPGVPTLLVAISRSGTTSETIAAAKQFQKQQRGPIIVITNYGDTPLAKLGNLTIAIPAGQELSVAQTRSFASMYVAVVALAVQIAGRTDLLKAMKDLPEVGENLLETYQSLAKTLGENPNFDRFYFLGSGPRYGLACETNLKMKEMTLTHSEPFHFFEFRHGPMSMVNESTVVVGMRSSTNARREQTVLDEMRVLGATTLSLGETDTEVAFHSSLPEEIRNVLYLPVLQLMAYYRSVAKGLNPDQPKNLNAVVELDLED